MKMLIKKIYTRFWFYLFWLFPLQDKVVFSSFSGKRYGDNPKYISDELLSLHPNIKQVWLYKEKFEMNEKIMQAKWGSILMIYHLATSKVWVDSHTKPEWVIKRKKQFFIETWHGGLGMKKIEGDAQEKLEKDIVKRTKHNSLLTDLLISNSDWLTSIYKRAFWYNGKILECGYPKNDILFQNQKHLEIRRKVQNYYNLNENTSILLYAPTFRDQNNQNYGISLEQIEEMLNKEEKENWIVAYRLHPLMEKNDTLGKENNKKIINMTKYPDIQELIIASGILITDYSSCIFDFAMLKKPGFIFANDLEKYEQERGLYFDLRTLPFPFSKTTEELITNILSFQKETYLKELEKYFEKMGLKENGNATSTIVQIIADKINKV